MSTEAYLQPGRRRDLRGSQRRSEILTMLEADSGESLSVEQIAESFGVSFATVRRDLARLHSEEGVTRTYGGASLTHPRAELSIGQRKTTRQLAKDRIGQLAAELVNEGDVIILDAGTTTEYLARYLEGIEDLTVFTNGIGAINRLIENESASVIVLGGQLRGINQTISGAQAESMLQNVYATTTFIGADAVDPEMGVASRTLEQARLKSLMMQHAREVVVVADSTKFDAGYFNYWSPLVKPWHLVTDDEASPGALDKLREAGAVRIDTAHLEPSNDPARAGESQGRKK